MESYTCLCIQVFHGHQDCELPVRYLSRVGFWIGVWSMTSVPHPRTTRRKSPWGRRSQQTAKSSKYAKSMTTKAAVRGQLTTPMTSAFSMVLRTVFSKPACSDQTHSKTMAHSSPRANPGISKMGTRTRSHPHISRQPIGPNISHMHVDCINSTRKAWKKSAVTWPRP